MLAVVVVVVKEDGLGAGTQEQRLEKEDRGLNDNMVVKLVT